MATQYSGNQQSDNVTENQNMDRQQGGTQKDSSLNQQPSRGGSQQTPIDQTADKSSGRSSSNQNKF